MLRFYYDTKYKYTNRTIINISSDNNYIEKDYANIDSPDTINGHIIYQLATGENIPTYIFDTDTNRRWFTSGITQLRTGKFQISLLRDLISESDAWKYEEAYVSAGVANDYNKYKIWNLPFTNTKVREERLPINGKSSFFVYYVNTQSISNNVLTEEDLQIKSTLLPGVSHYDKSVSSLSAIPNFEYVGAGQLFNWETDSCLLRTFLYNDYNNDNEMRRVDFDYQNGNIPNTPNIFSGPVSSNNTAYITTPLSKVLNNTNNNLTSLQTAISNWIPTYRSTLGTAVMSSSLTSLNDYVDKIIYNTSNQKVYKIKRTQSSVTYNTPLGSGSEINTLKTAIRNIDWPPVPDKSFYLNFENNFIQFKNSVTIYEYTLEELGQGLSCDFNFTATQRKLPKSAVRCVNIVSDENISDNELAQTLMILQANALNLNNDTGKILDVQFLPFQVANSTNENIKVNNNPMIAAFLDSDDFFYQTDLTDLLNINKETDSIKIVSPSRASQFLFKPYNNGGNMLFNTSITIKPYTTTIYIRPSTLGLLVNDWDDKDCLVINEDFSLTVVNSEWANYIYTNRNYENSFNRQIQGRSVERNWERKIEVAQAKSDEWTSRNISSQKAKTYTGNIPILSDIAGAIGTAWKDKAYLDAAQIDRDYNEAMYQESVSLAKDSYSYQLDNLQSQPTIPSKITTIDIKFLDGVYLEHYSTNSTELLAINNYYKYNGNRIDAYGTFLQYYGWFVRGKIIKSISYTQPEINEINKRLNLGIFTEVQYDQ